MGGWMFLLIPAHPGSPSQRAVKRLLLLLFDTSTWSGRKLLGISDMCILQARCPACHGTNSIKAQKETESTDPKQEKLPTGLLSSLNVTKYDDDMWLRTYTAIHHKIWPDALHSKSSSVPVPYELSLWLLVTDSLLIWQTIRIWQFQSHISQSSPVFFSQLFHSGHSFNLAD